jgi:hypothetical protein
LQLFGPTLLLMLLLLLLLSPFLLHTPSLDQLAVENKEYKKAEL